MRAVAIVLLTSPDCHFCDDAKTALERLSSEFAVRLKIVSFESPEGQDIALANGLIFPPGLLLDGKPFSQGRLPEAKLRRELQLMRERLGEVHQPAR